MFLIKKLKHENGEKGHLIYLYNECIILYIKILLHLIIQSEMSVDGSITHHTPAILF